jgi:hypothetical protein
MTQQSNVMLSGLLNWSEYANLYKMGAYIKRCTGKPIRVGVEKALAERLSLIEVWENSTDTLYVGGKDDLKSGKAVAIPIKYGKWNIFHVRAESKSAYHILMVHEDNKETSTTNYNSDEIRSNTVVCASGPEQLKYIVSDGRKACYRAIEPSDGSRSTVVLLTFN